MYVYYVCNKLKQGEITMKYTVIEKDYINGEEKVILETEDRDEARDLADSKNSKRLSNDVQYVVKEE